MGRNRSDAVMSFMAGNQSINGVSGVPLQHQEHRFPLGEALGSDQAMARGTQGSRGRRPCNSITPYPLGELQSEELLKAITKLG